MTEQNMTKRELEAQNAELHETVAAQENFQAQLLKRIEQMEARIEEKQAEGGYVTPAPELRRDPFDKTQNPLTILKHPKGKWLSWKNPNIRNHRGWDGWVPVTYDDQIGKDLAEYLPSPPDRLAGSSSQDNYVRRGQDSILCWLPIELWEARQYNREAKALRRQMAVSNNTNKTLSKGVSTFGDGAVEEKLPAGAMVRSAAPVPPGDLHHRTEMLQGD